MVIIAKSGSLDQKSEGRSDAALGGTHHQKDRRPVNTSDFLAYVIFFFLPLRV